MAVEGSYPKVNGDIPYASEVNDFNTHVVGDGSDHADVATNTAAIATFAAPPIGSVTAWLKDYTNTPNLPSGWVECNGQVLDDGDSVYDTQTIPNLNEAVSGGLKGYFLRGHTSSDVTEVSQNLAHTHTMNSGTGTSGSGYPEQSSSYSDSDAVTTKSSGGTEARPHNYSVVWIMRIK